MSLEQNLSESSSLEFYHQPVLSTALINGLCIQPEGCYLDCTVGGGGHSILILEASPSTKLFAIDQDQAAIAAAQKRLSAYQDRVQYWHGNFSEYRPPQSVLFDGIVADLGVSSAQLDRPERGFSFREAGALDMRMNQQQTRTAADIVNFSQEVDLANIFFELGEERLSRRIARAIVQSRPFSTTTQLAEVISHSVPRAYRYGRIHPATRVFQALRIAVNQELTVLADWLKLVPNWLKPQGKIGVISFHSLEDRIVKHALRQDERLQVITKKPIIATDEEILKNPRSRSAKLRIAQKL